MKLVVFGASSETGRQLVRLALEQGHKVIAQVMAKEDLSPHQDLISYPSDLRDYGSVVRCLEHSDVAFCVFGPTGDNRDGLCREAMENILNAMKRNDVYRVVCLTDAMVGHPNLDFFYRALRRLLPPKQRRAIEDQSQQERLITASHANWTIVRPPRVVDSTSQKPLAVGETLPVSILSKVTRLDLATYLLSSVGSGNVYRKAVAIANKD